MIRLLSLPAVLVLFSGLYVSSAQAQPAVDLTVGQRHICVINEGGVVDCSTGPFNPRYDAPAGLPALIDIAAGAQHTCGIDVDGNAVCWGAEEPDSFGFVNGNFFGELDIPAIDQPLVSIAAGEHHTCAIDVTNRVWCWGLDSNQRTVPPGDGLGEDGTGFVKVAGGLESSCGIQTNGDIACWSDSNIGTYTNVPGPFIDLDIAYGKACGLKQNGEITCWNSFRLDISVPTNGPYTDLAVTQDGICGLDQDQQLDCTFREGLDVSALGYPLATTFTEIESGVTDLFGRVPVCGITTSGSVECLKGTDLPEPPGDEDLTALNIGLNIRHYGPNRTELFWNEPPSTFSSIKFEVFRNGESVTVTDARYSWYDDSVQATDETAYAVRAIDRSGNVGPMSELVIVNNETGEVTQADTLAGVELPSPMHTVSNIQVVPVSGSRLVSWNGSVPGQDGLKGYEVRINNEPVQLTSSFVYFVAGLGRDECTLYSVAAIADDNSIIDYTSLVINNGGRSQFNCFDDR